jgi:hypothetical protein
MVSYPINEVIDLISEYVQPTDLNVEVVINVEKRAANIAKLKKEMDEKKAKAVKKKSSRTQKVNTTIKKNTHSLGPSKPREHGGRTQLGVRLYINRLETRVVRLFA